MTDAQASSKVEIAHVLTMDVVEYSTLLITEQSRIMAELKRIVRDTARFRRAEAEEKLICLPTGDGMALVFFGDHEAPIECAIEISAAIKNHPEIGLRMGIHSGPVDVVLDVNERANVAGAGIDMAQRVMDYGDAGHILLSRHAAEDLAPFPRWNPYLHDLGECEVKHGRKISLVNFYTDEIGNPEPPKRCSAPKGKVASRSTTLFEGISRGRRAFPQDLAFLGAVVVSALILGALFYRIGSHKSASPRLGNGANSGAGKSIAVLPFENLSHDPDNAYFADGIQEEILTRLSKIADLKVISRTSTQRYKSAPTNLSEIAKQLGVAHILEGSVQKAADQVRVNVQLVNAANDSHVWADKFDRKLTDIFAVESEIAAKIAETLKAKLTGAEQRAIASRPTENSEAHQLYLKGRYYWNKWLGPGFEKSRDYYQQAIDLDPTYALAYAGLADYYGFAFANGLLPPEEKWAKAEEETASKALELDPTLGEAYNPLAAAKLYYHRDWPAAENYFHRGLELSPNFAEMHHHYALCLVLFGRNEEALAEMQRALELDPLSPRFNWNLGRLLFFVRQYDRALDQYRKTLELDPNNAAAHEWLGFACEKKGMQKEAIAEWSRALTLSGEDTQASILQRTYATSGFGAAVRALAQKRLERLNERTSRGEYVAAVEFVIAHVRLDDKEQAFAWLAKAVEERNRLAFQIKVDPIFDPLRSDARFDRLLEKIYGAAKDNAASRIQIKSIAVLPFENLSRDPDNAYFADGIQEEILTRLSKIADLKVISRTSTQRYKSAPENLLEVAKQLGVANILEGAVQKAADQVRVNVQLINAQSDSHLWAEKYDRKLTDIFAVESEIATKIADSLQTKLTASQRQAITARPTENSEAHQLYLRGRYYWNKRAPQSLNKAIEYFEQALNKDPNYALAYAGLAETYALLGDYDVAPPTVSIPKGKAAALKALEIDDTLAEAHNSLAYDKTIYDWDFAGAKREYQRAIELSPNYATAHQWYGEYLTKMGRFDDALAELNKAHDLDPLSLIINVTLGWHFYLARQYDRAIEQLHSTLEMDPGFISGHVMLERAYRAKRMYNDAIAEARKARELVGEEKAQLLEIANTYALSGQTREAKELIEKSQEFSKREYIAPTYFVFAYAALGEKDQAFASLQKAYQERDSMLSNLKVEPMFDTLRSDRRFTELLKRMNFSP